MSNFVFNMIVKRKAVFCEMRLFYFFISVMLLGCAKPDQSVEDITRIDSTAHTLFVGRGQSSITINNSGDSTRCYDIKDVDYEVIQIAPKGEWINYIARKSTSTLTCDGQEGQKRTIIIELNPVDRPKHTAFVIRHEADEINLEHDYYQTVYYGCCDAEPIHKVYDYENKLITEGTARILIGAIPNNPIKFFISYKPEPLDTTKLGSIFVAYDQDEKYQVDILSPPLPPEMCSQYAPEVSLVSRNRYDTLEIYENEYQLWDLENIDDPSQIRNLFIRVKFLCDPYFTIEEIEIPITGGKPFGKDDKVQSVTLVNELTMESGEETD